MAIPIECERRFLVSGEEWRSKVRHSRKIRQGYLTTADDVTVRVRRIGSSSAYLTIKTPHEGVGRVELEYQIPPDHADFLMETACGSRIVKKTRHEVTANGVSWVIDEFEGDNLGLVIAEVELECMERQLTLPDWVGPEVTAIDRFHNSHLAEHPFADWDELKRA